ncbi:MAG: ABC transporter permease [Lachnospiraceae bacterium]
MNTPKRSLLYVVRKRSRTLLLFVILLVVSTLVLSGLSIMDAAGDSSTELRESTGASFTMERNLSTATKSNSGNTFVYQQEYITDEMIEKISEIDGIKGYNAKKECIPDIQDINGKNLETIVYTNWYDDPILKYNSKLFASLNTSYDSYFTSNEFQLTEGRHIEPNDEYKILMSNELAEKYNLKVGDKIKLALTEEFVSAEKQSGTSDISVNDVEIEIIGIYNILTEQSDKNTLAQSELYENYIFSDIASFTELFSTWPAAMEEFGDGYGEADFFVSDPAQLGSIMSEVSNISSINWNNLTMNANDEVYQASSNSMSNVEKLITTMIIVVVIIAAAIVTLILSMWVRSRVRETGILMSTGIAKYKIVAQFVLETVLIAAFAFALSYFTSNAIAGNLGHIIDSTIATGDVQVAMSSFILVCCAGIAVILAAIGISSIPVMRMKPREILSKMS